MRNEDDNFTPDGDLTPLGEFWSTPVGEYVAYMTARGHKIHPLGMTEDRKMVLIAVETGDHRSVTVGKTANHGSPGRWENSYSNYLTDIEIYRKRFPVDLGHGEVF